MNRSTTRSILAISVLILAAFIFAAQADDMSPNDWPTNFGPDDGTPPELPSGPTSLGEPDAGTDSAPTTSRPSAGSAPSTTFAASTGATASDFGQGEPITETQMMSAGSLDGGSSGLLGATGVGGTGFSNINYWVLYNGAWSRGPAAIFHGQRTNCVVSNGQSQNIWSYEKYPGGYEVWKYWGYWHSGNYNTWFSGDANGWHLIAIYGDASGWSNPIWISVVPSSPYYVNGQPHPDWLSGSDIEISGTGGDISFHGSGDVDIHESTNLG
ncbi:MAG TPA: hypothetical protein HA349_10590 [Methanotrichaceae archaeon]|nr:hypothetical protein [Methanotrichaceae archaeon]